MVWINIKQLLEKNVFVGSDTQFVAPVNIEDDVLIGAGSTVTGNVKKGDLYLTSKSKTIDGYFYKHFSNKRSKMLLKKKNISWCYWFNCYL